MGCRKTLRVEGLSGSDKVSECQTRAPARSVSHWCLWDQGSGSGPHREGVNCSHGDGHLHPCPPAAHSPGPSHSRSCQRRAGSSGSWAAA